MPKIRTHLRVGDKVRIVIPRFIKRVGYPKCPEDYLINVPPTRVSNALAEVLGHASMSPRDIQHMCGTDKFGKMTERVRHDIAYLIAKADGFGGRERTIHWYDETENSKALIGKECTVVAVRTVVTGTWHPGSAYHDYYGSEDSEPPYLDNQVHHRIAEVNVHPHWVTVTRWWEGLRAPFSHFERLAFNCAEAQDAIHCLGGRADEQ